MLLADEMTTSSEDEILAIQALAPEPTPMVLTTLEFEGKLYTREDESGRPVLSSVPPRPARRRRSYFEFIRDQGHRFAI